VLTISLAEKVQHGLHFSDGSPYVCLGFRFDDKVVYLSDVSYIPEDVWRLLEGAPDTTRNGTASPDDGDNVAPPEVFVIDCLRLLPHASHFGVAQAISAALRLRPKRTYLTGFAHKVTHDSWHQFGLALTSGERCKSPRPLSTKGQLQPDMGATVFEAQGQPIHNEADSDVFKEIALREVEGYQGGPAGKIWVRPAYDGLSIWMNDDGTLKDQDE
jgi:hypothetical protein